MKMLLIVTAIIEGLTGLGLLVIPGIVVPLTLGSAIDSPSGIVGTRLAGAAILSLAACCWQTRNSERSGPGLGVVAAMIFYNIAAAAVLVYAGVRLGLQSPYIWPIIVIHGVMALWCAAVVRFSTRRTEVPEE